MMRTILADAVSKTVARLCIKANFHLRPDVLSALISAYKKERDKSACGILKAIIRNARVAAQEQLAICQDTGLPCVFVEMGQNVRVKGDLLSAIRKGVVAGYKQGFLRNSIVMDPLKRGKPAHSPALIHLDISRGSRLKITVLPKGFGCENKTQLRMLKPTAGVEDVKRFVIDAVKEAGPDACPPYVVGVGIGGTADYACLLAKKALLEKVTRSPGHRVTRSPAHKDVGRLERELLEQINKLKIGPMGMGGKITALAVNILTHPTHIAGLPVAVNISCHALRSASAKI